MRTEQRILTGWALRNRDESSVLQPENRTVLEDLRDHIADKTVIGRGGGTSYGDAALNESGFVADLRRLNRILDYDSENGIISCEAGLTLVDLQAAIVPDGWFVPTIPGAGQATLGGCVCCDVHGKNHEIQGTFGHNVIGLVILTANGEVVKCGPKENAALYWATVGGMGLTGIILAVTLRLIPVETAFMMINVTKTNSLEETFSAQIKSSEHDYSVTWLDPLSPGDSLGRGVVMNARHMRKTELPARHAANALRWPDIRSYGFAWTPARGLFRPGFLKAFNSLYYASQGNSTRVRHAHPYLFPLHTFKDINRLYGTNGFFEYQIAVPDEGAYDFILHILLEIRKYNAGSFMTVLKRFGSGNLAPMSFPIPGITFSIQILANNPDILKLLDRLDEKTAELGGRVYLAKDSRLTPHVLDAMYPQRKNWAEFLNEIDPDLVFESNMSRRLGLREIV